MSDTLPDSETGAGSNPASDSGTAAAFGGGPDRRARRPLRLALLGFGRMGRAVYAEALERGHSFEVIVSPHPEGASGSGTPSSPVTHTRLQPEALEGVDVAIDVSVAAAVQDHARICAEAGVDLVVGTTGWDDARDRVEAMAREAGIGLLVAPNFSLGVTLFFDIVRHAARLVNGVDDARDASIHDAHHRHKADHPGGTARRLAELVVEELDRKSTWSLDLPAGEAVPDDVLQVSVTRAGEIPGTHSVLLDGPHDTIELVHRARSRAGFARGAILAAEWICGRSGVFSMDDLLDPSPSSSTSPDSTPDSSPDPVP